MSNATSLAMIASTAWDFVVLQEQSYLPTIPGAKNAYMFPGAQSLDASISSSDPSTQVLLYQTWGRQYGGHFCWGGCEDFADFDEMQDALTAAYAECADLIEADVAPVGEAWRLAFIKDPAIVLHKADESHPNLEGSYLAACVFYAKIFDESPIGLSYTAGVDPTTALFLQTVAHEAVYCQTSYYCKAKLNSTGLRAKIFASGSTSLAHNDFTLTSTNLPDGTFGLFFWGDSPVDPGITFGNGRLCIGAPLRRLGVHAAIGGVVEEKQDFGSHYYQHVVAGQEYYYQFWYRDAAAGGAGYNTTRGLAVTFCP